MKLGVSMWSYVAATRQGMDIPGFIREAHRQGVDGVELLDYFWKDRGSEMPAVMAALEETGLPVGVYSVSNNFANADPDARKAQVDVIKRGIDSANLFGAKVVRVFAGDVKPGLTFHDVFEWVVTGLSEAAAYAEAQGVVLALENHGTLAGRSNQVANIIQQVGSTALRANPDTGNFLLVHQAPHIAVSELASLAGMVHFKDFEEVPDSYDGFAYQSIDGVKFTGKAIGEGEVDLADCLLFLKDAQFDGWLNIEYEGQENPLTAVARSITTTKKLMSEAGVR